jgi:hypothetical protein
MSHRLRGLIGFLTSICLATPLFATTVEKMDLPQLVSVSNNIVEGRVASTETRFEENTIFTYTTVNISDPLKGDRRRSVVLKHPGGVIGSRALIVSGIPQFKTGDQVIVFLRDRKDGTFDVVGLGQGKYDITNNEAVASVSGVAVLDPKTGRLSDAGLSTRTTVDALKSKIRELAR